MVALTVVLVGCGQGYVVSSSTSTSVGSLASAIPPIGGYGDFSDVEYWNVDWYEVTRLEVACLNDNGYPVTLIPPGDGISYSAVPPEQSLEANEVSKACREGLRLPQPVPPTHEQISEAYDWALETASCLEKEGFSIPAPPTREVFIDSYFVDPWVPFAYADPANTLSPIEWSVLNAKCPQGRPPD